MLALGSRVEQSKIATQEIYVPVHNSSGGFLGVFRIIITAVEVLVAFIPGIGAEASAAIGLAFTAAQAGITGASYAQGNIRSTGQLFGALAIDVIPGGGLALSTTFKALRTEAIIVETLNDALETQKVNRVFTRGTSEFKENLKMLKTEGLSKTGKIQKVDGSLTKVSKVSKKGLANYRTAYLKQQAKLGRDTADIRFDDYELRINDLIPTKTEEPWYFNRDRAILRNIKNSRNFLANNPQRYEELIDATATSLSPEVQAYIRSQGKNVRQAIDGLVDYSTSRKLTSRINKIFASGESDWASREFWSQVKNGKVLKSSNFWTQAAQAMNANDVGREIITKPFNALIRKNKEFIKGYRDKTIKKWIKRIETAEMRTKGLGGYMDKEARAISDAMEEEKAMNREVVELQTKFRRQVRGKTQSFKNKLAKKLVKGTKYEEKIRKAIGKEGRYWGGSLVMGYRVLQDLAGQKVIQVYFNRINTNALTPGSKNRGGKKDLIIPITEHRLKQWQHSASKSEWYLSHLALSRGGRPIGFEVADGMFSNFLTFVPLPALRNILSIISNIKSVGKDIAKGKFFNEWIGNFAKTVKRLWIHKVGKLAGSTLSIFGHGAGKEGQRIGLGIAKGFQHRGGQSLGAFNARGLLKETAPTAFRGTVLRGGQRRVSAGHMRGIGQSKLSVQRYATNIRRVVGIPKIK